MHQECEFQNKMPMLYAIRTFWGDLFKLWNAATSKNTVPVDGFLWTYAVKIITQVLWGLSVWKSHLEENCSVELGIIYSNLTRATHGQL
jgi:hypothetical protein